MTLISDSQNESYSQSSTITFPDIHFSNQISSLEIYLRNTNKKSVKIAVNTHMKLHSLMDIISQKNDISTQNLIVYWEGQKHIYEQSNNLVNLSFRDKGIVHIRDKRKIVNNKGEVWVEIYEKEGRKIGRKNFIIEGNRKICVFIQKLKETFVEFEEAEIDLVECGRKLREQCTFEEEEIEEETTITIRLTETVGSLTEKIVEEKKMLKETQAQNYFSPNVKKSYSLIPSFKKKQKSSVLYRSSSKAEPDLMWESDSGSDLTQKQLLTSLWKKKQKENLFSPLCSFSKKKYQETQCEQLSIRDTFQFNFQTKLVRSQYLNYQSEIEQLKPPEIDEDFFDDNEQSDFVQKQSQTNEKNYLHFSDSHCLMERRKKGKEMDFDNDPNIIMEI